MNNCDFLGHFQLAPPALFAPTHRKMFVTNLLAEFLNVPCPATQKTQSWAIKPFTKKS
jgi:hypothetical protein